MWTLLNMQEALNKKKNERGTTIVEAAIFLMAIFIILFGVMEAGRFLNVEQVLTNAAREGARFAVAPLSGTNTLPTEAEIQTVVNNFLSSANVTATDIYVAPNVQVATGLITTTFTQVRVTTDYQVLTIPVFDMLEVELSGEAMMRNETSQ
jgi:Flp pilus assembly protein TadG